MEQSKGPCGRRILITRPLNSLYGKTCKAVIYDRSNGIGCLYLVKPDITPRYGVDGSGLNYETKPQPPKNKGIYIVVFEDDFTYID
jgi:hypothetical protein